MIEFNEIGEPISTPEINQDELVGYIMRNAYEFDGIRLDYDDVKAVLDSEMEFLKQKGIAE